MSKDLERWDEGMERLMAAKESIFATGVITKNDSIWLRGVAALERIDRDKAKLIKERNRVQRP